MNSFIKLIIVTLVAVVIMVFLLLSLAPGLMVKNLINRYSESFLGVKAECSSVNVSFLSGKGSILDIIIHNPSDKEYFYNNAINIKKISFVLDKKALRKKIVRLLYVNIGFATFNYEQYPASSNFIDIIKLIKLAVDQDNQLSKKSDNLREKKSVKQVNDYSFLIEELIIVGAKANFYLAPTESELLKVSVPDLTLRHIGGIDGLNVSGVVRDVLISINQKIVSDILRKNADISSIDKNLKESLDVVSKNVKKNLDAAGKIFGKFKNIFNVD